MDDKKFIKTQSRKTAELLRVSGCVEIPTNTPLWSYFMNNEDVSFTTEEKRHMVFTNVLPV